jgi:hypothetical protein
MSLLEGRRISPVIYAEEPLETEPRDGWEVVLEYKNEAGGPWLVDLSHRPKWDLQADDLSQVSPWGLNLPESPGHCLLAGGVLINRMNRIQASVWHLGPNPLEPPDGNPFTETTDGLALVALIGPEIQAIMEKVSPLDLAVPTKKPPFLVQGPVLHVPSQIVVLKRSRDLEILILAMSRGYGQSMADTLLQAGAQWNLRPGGERIFTQRIENTGD